MKKFVIKLETIVEVPEEDLESNDEAKESSSSSTPTISGSTSTLKSRSTCNLTSYSNDESVSLSSVSSSEWNAFYPPWTRYQPKYPKRLRNKLNPKITNPGPTILRVKNLRDDISDQEVYKLFKVFGDVESVNIYYDVFGRSTGTADVIFLLRKSASDAVDVIRKTETVGGEKYLRARIIRRKRRAACAKN
nr:polyadenylate-binding protein, cytoplasmic and nuclear-like [Onthophagus taurus]